MSAVDEATPHIDAVLRDHDEDGPEDRHLIAWVTVGLYESLDSDEPGYIGISGNSNTAAHVGLLEMGRTILCD